jgi:uncharacterized membrane protein
MNFVRSHVVNLLLVAVSFAVAGFFYGAMPQIVPTHWGSDGVANGFTSKPWGPFVLPLVTAATFAMLAAIPALSPRGFGVDSFVRAYRVVVSTIVAFLACVSVFVTMAQAGHGVPMDRVAHVAAGALFVVLGNYLGKFTKNFFMGIRTPWTLASDEVWLRTHRLGGKLFVLAGLALLVGGAVGAPSMLLIVAVTIAAGVPSVYSFVLYRRLEGVGRAGQ